jgi:hypothetical protein
MVFPVSLTGRLLIPVIVAAFLAKELPGQFDFYDKMLRLTDLTLSTAEGQGDGPIEEFDFIIGKTG